MLAEGAAGEGITASYRYGVLEVVMPKAAQRAEPRQTRSAPAAKPPSPRHGTPPDRGTGRAVAGQRAAGS